MIQLAPTLPKVLRLGLASRGNSRLCEADVEYALKCGMNYLNWCGHPDAMSRTIARLGSARKDVVVAVQLEARTAATAEREFDQLRHSLNSNAIDVVTLYYVESDTEWEQIIGPEGAWNYLWQEKQRGSIQLIGLTSHQRRNAAKWARRAAPKTGAGDRQSATKAAFALDLLMIRYNAAHRGAETDVFPSAQPRELPVVTFTALRWGALMESTPDDPPGFHPPSAAVCYRWCLMNPSASVVLAAPSSRGELDSDLNVVSDWQPLDPDQYAALTVHGDRVRKHAGYFP